MEPEALGHDADHLEGLAARLDRLADGRGGAAEAAVEQGMTKHGDVGAAFASVFRNKGAAELRPDSQNIEKVDRRRADAHLLRLPVAGKLRVNHPHRCQRLDRPQLVPHQRNLVAVNPGARYADPRQLVQTNPRRLRSR